MTVGAEAGMLSDSSPDVVVVELDRVTRAQDLSDLFADLHEDLLQALRTATPSVCIIIAITDPHRTRLQDAALEGVRGLLQSVALDVAPATAVNAAVVGASTSQAESRRAVEFLRRAPHLSGTTMWLTP